MKRLLAVLSFFLVGTLFAATVSEDQVQQVVLGWLSLEQFPMGQLIDADISSVEMYESGEGFFYVASLSPAGFVVVNGDDRLEPIVAFSTDGEFDYSTENPLKAMVQADTEYGFKLLEHLDGGLQTLSTDSLSDAQTKWQKLVAYSGSNLMLLGISSISDVLVSPLTHTEWGQTTECGGEVYNYYTPNNYPSGCVATAMAQVMYYHQYPTAGIGVISNTITVNDVAQTATTRGGDGYGGAYVWSDMALNPNCYSSSATKRAIGALCSDAGVAVGMQYFSSYASAYDSDAALAFTEYFDYAGASYINGYPDDIHDSFGPVINANLNAGLPVILGVLNSVSNSGHAIVCDGYGYNFGTMYHHLNMGWQGTGNVWYNLPTIESANDYDAVYDAVYNISPYDDGGIISGRVLSTDGNPVEGVKIVAGSKTVYTSETGVYAVTGLSAATYTITMTYSGVSSQQLSKQLQYKYDSNSGVSRWYNVWGADFTIEMQEQHDLSVQADGTAKTVDLSQTDECNIGFTIYYDGSESIDFGWKIVSSTDYQAILQNPDGLEALSTGSLSGFSSAFVGIVREEQFSGNDVVYYRLFVDTSDNVTETNESNNWSAVVSVEYYIDLAGEGTEANPYEISSTDDFTLAAAVYQLYDRCFSLSCDLDFAGIEFNNSPFSPNTIQVVEYLGNPFTGTFSGNGHSISNLSIYAPYTNCIGLFGAVGPSGSVEDLHLDNVSIVGKRGKYIGGFAGQSDGVISKCSITSSSVVGGQSSSFVGAIAGGLSGSVASIFNCYTANMQEISGSVKVGGICGEAIDGAAIDSCYVATEDLAEASYRGPIAGSLDSSSISSSFWDYQLTGNGDSLLQPAVGQYVSGQVEAFAKTTAQMQSPETFVDWQWRGVWFVAYQEYPAIVKDADINVDGVVNSDDFFVIADYWLLEGQSSSDLNRDEKINLADLAILAYNWSL